MKENSKVADAPVKSYTIKTFTGQIVDLRTGPRPEQVDILDIARSLATTNRYLGHTGRPLSTAEHSVYVTELCDLGMYKLYFLLHDSPEAYYHDLVKPFKNLLEDYTDIYDKLSKQCMRAICQKFGLSFEKFLELYPLIKEADNKVADLERRFTNESSVRLPKDHVLHGAAFGMTWQDAEAIFITMFEEYTK